MKPHLPTALRRALLAALAVAALAPAAWAETFTLTQDTSYKCGEGDWSLGAAFKSEITEVSYTFTSNPENKYSLSFSGGTDGVFCDYSGASSFDYLTFTQLNGLSFSGNTAGSWGGAIHSNSTKQALSFVNNDSVLFQGNVANSADPTSIQLQGLFLRNTNGRGSFSAPKEGSITFYDSIYVVGTVELNQSFDDDGDADTEAIAQTGTITFSGATAEDDLKAHLYANNMQLSEEQLANALAASRTSEIRGTTTLYAGTLEVVDGAVLTGGDKINSSGASVEDSYANGGLELAEDSAATLYLRGGSIDKVVTLGETSQLKAEGENNNITAFTVDEGASLTVSAYEQEGKPTVAGELTIADELVLNGTATVAEGATITLGSSTTLASAISNDGTVALAGEITLNGFTKETVYTYSAGSNSGYRTTSEGYAVITGTGTTTSTATKEGYGEGSEYKQRNIQFCIKK